MLMIKNIYDFDSDSDLKCLKTVWNGLFTSSQWSRLVSIG